MAQQEQRSGTAADGQRRPERGVVQSQGRCSDGAAPTHETAEPQRGEPSPRPGRVTQLELRVACFVVLVSYRSTSRFF